MKTIHKDTEWHHDTCICQRIIMTRNSSRNSHSATECEQHHYITRNIQSKHKQRNGTMEMQAVGKSAFQVIFSKSGLKLHLCITPWDIHWINFWISPRTAPATTLSKRSASIWTKKIKKQTQNNNKWSMISTKWCA